MNCAYCVNVRLIVDDRVNPLKLLRAAISRAWRSALGTLGQLG